MTILTPDGSHFPVPRAPGGADNRNATTEAQGFQDAADRAQYLYERGGASIIYGGRGVSGDGGAWISIPVTAAVAATGALWEFVYAPTNVSPGEPRIRTTSGSSTTARNSFVIPLSPFLPVTGKLRGIAIDILPATHVGLPEHFSNMVVFDCSMLGLNMLGALDAYGLASADFASDVAAYNARHQMTSYTPPSGSDMLAFDLASDTSLYLEIGSECDTTGGGYALSQTEFMNPRVWVSP